jgi:carbonic anhydrase
MEPRLQSPVDIPTQAPRHRDGIAWSYGRTPLVIGNNPTAVQVDCAPGSDIVLDGTLYELEQFHLHCPGEHTLAGDRSPMELHLVHRAPDASLAVVGVRFVEGMPNTGLEPLVAVLAGDAGPMTIKLEDLLPADRSFVAYLGSLTAPPLDEGVAWRVLTETLQASSSQLRAIGAVHPSNSRAIQPLNGRTFR